MEPQEDPQPNTTNINTDGGANIQGNVTAAHDVTGRDAIHGNQYNAETINISYVNYVNKDGTPKAVPNMLPRRTTRHFTGRAADLAWIIQNIAPDQTLVISAPGGMGKTTLSIEAVNWLALNDKLYELFPDGIIFHSFYGRPQIALAFETILTAYGRETKGDAEQLARQALAGKRPLIILDGCEDVKEQQGLRTVVDALGQSGVLVTTRSQSHGRLGQLRELDRLIPDEALHLLRTLSAENEVADETGIKICKCVDHLPLGVDIAGNYLRESGEEPAEYLASLEEKPIEALDIGKTRRESMYRMVSKSVERLDSWGKELLLALGQFAYLPLPVWVLEELFAMKKRGFAIHLREMERYGLVKVDRSMVSCAHALVHGYGRDVHFSDTHHTTEMLEKVWQWLNENLRVWQKETPPEFGKCDALRGHVMGVLERLEQREQWEAANKLVWALGPGDGYLVLQGHFAENIIALEMGVRVCQQMGTRSDENAHLTHLALAFRGVGQVEKSIQYLERAVEVDRQMGDRKGEGADLGNLGNAYSDLGRVEEAIEHYEQALLISREIGDRQGEGNQLGNLGIAYKNLGRVEEAIKHHEQALLISREIGDRQGEGNQLGNLGNAYADLGQIEKAMAFYEQALVIDEEIGNIQGKAIRLANMGLRYKNDLNDPAKAKALWQEALAIFEKIGHPYADLVRGGLNDLENEEK
ncbi:MAG: tetratricopeptide (TPR) repeat protein [Candidatus Promineifilaceae bacterium]|jgi:tetratricopeptide (TPR) repeat protein